MISSLRLRLTTTPPLLFPVFTGQEELWSWLNYFGDGYTAKRDQTLETLSAVMSSLPHWGYSGIGE